jgi:hypothetical protein
LDVLAQTIIEINEITAGLVDYSNVTEPEARLGIQMSERASLLPKEFDLPQRNGRSVCRCYSVFPVQISLAPWLQPGELSSLERRNRLNGFASEPTPGPTGQAMV